MQKLRRAGMVITKRLLAYFYCTTTKPQNLLPFYSLLQANKSSQMPPALPETFDYQLDREITIGILLKDNTLKHFFFCSYNEIGFIRTHILRCIDTHDYSYIVGYNPSLHQRLNQSELSRRTF